MKESVGNGKIPDEFDRDPATAVTVSTNGAKTLFLIAPSSRNDQTNLRSDCDRKMTGSPLVGTVLASRYKILETIHVNSFKAHDLALDQTVTVRQTLLTSQCAGDTGRQKVQQLALVRDPNFLNILDVIFDKSSDFVITERPRGHSIADLLRGRSRFDLEGVLRLVTPLAGALDLAAPFSCCPNPISTCWLFTETRNSFAVDPEQRSLSDWPPFLVKLDVWELVRPKKKKTWPFLTTEAQTGDARGLAVRQAALFTYELLGGEKTKEDEVEVKRWFKPVNGLGDAGNSILYLGLQGSPLFERSGCFFHQLKSTIQSGDGEPRVSHAFASLTPEHSVALPDTNDVIRRFNRETGWLATLVVGAVASAALIFAVLIPERHSKASHLTQEARRAEGGLVLDATPATRFTVVDLNGKRSTGKMTSGEATSLDHASTEISPQENLSLRMEAPASTPTPVLAFTPETIRQDVHANAGFWTPTHRQDSGRVTGLTVSRARSRSSVRFRFVNVKMRLIELWHQSLVRSERSRSWTLFSNSNKGYRKKVSYTAETNHRPKP